MSLISFTRYEGQEGGEQEGREDVAVSVPSEMRWLRWLESTVLRAIEKSRFYSRSQLVGEGVSSSEDPRVRIDVLS